MRKKVTIPIFLCFIILFSGFAEYREDCLFRRIRSSESSPEFILDAELVNLVPLNLITLIVNRIREIDGFLGNISTEFTPSTWRIGLILAILKDISGLGLEQLDIASWIKENRRALLSFFPDLEIPSSSGPFEALKDRVKQTAEIAYKGIQNTITNYYFITFIQNSYPSINLLDQDKQMRHLFILQGILNLHILRNRTLQASQLIPDDYIPDFQRLGEMQHSNLYADNIEGYLLKKLIKFELEGYASRYLRTFKYAAEIANITEVVLGLDIGEVRRRVGIYYAGIQADDSVTQRLISSSNEKILKNVLIEAEISTLIEADIQRFVQENYPEVRRIVWSIFNFIPSDKISTLLISNAPLIDNLTISEAEYLVRKVMSIYFEGSIGKNVQEIGETGYFDPHFYTNKNKSRIALVDWENTLGKLEEIKAALGANPDPYRENRVVLYYLIKKLATAGIYDLSVEDIRTKFAAQGNISGLEATGDLRQYAFAVSSFNKLYNEVLASNLSEDPVIKNQRIKLIINVDNHGEIIYALGLIQYILKINPNIVIYLLPRKTPAGDDAYSNSVWQILNDDGGRFFGQLTSQSTSPDRRFFISNEGSDFQGQDLSTMPKGSDIFTSKQVGRMTVDKIVYLGIGNANFCSTQGLELERYYLFRVKAERVAEATGISREGYPLVLAYLDPGACIGTSFGKERYGNLLQYVDLHKEFFDPPLGGYSNH